MLTLKHVGCALSLSVVMAASASAQVQRRIQPSTMDKATEISPGDTVQLLSRLVVSGAPGAPAERQLAIQYTSRIGAGDATARQTQADRAASHFGRDAQRFGATRLQIALCDSRACAETREPPTAVYDYAFAGGEWKRVPR